MAQPLYPERKTTEEQHWFRYDTTSKDTGTAKERGRTLRRGPRENLATDAPKWQDKSPMKQTAQHHNIGTYYGRCACGITAVAYNHADLIKRLKTKHRDVEKRRQTQ